MGESRIGADDSGGSVFLRIQEPTVGRVVASLVEIDRDGYIPREIGLAKDGSPVYVTRIGEYGIWNDSPIPRTAPGTSEFDDQWGGRGTRIDRDEFEAVFAKADQTLPHTSGGLPVWVETAVSLTILAGVLVVVGAVVFFVAGLLGFT